MPSREEDIKKYLAKRERKKNRQHIANNNESKPIRVEGKRDPESFATFYQLSNGQSRLITTIIIAIPVCIGLSVFLTYSGVEPNNVFITALITSGIIGLISYAGMLKRHDAYKKFASGKDSIEIGWNQFIAGRDDGFWNGGNYTYVKIQFDQDYQVPELERKAVAAFMQTWINDWGFRYRGKWTSGVPREFNMIGADRLEGHVNITGGVPFMMNQFMEKLPELMSLITPGSLRVQISAVGSDLSTSIDDADEREEERRSDQRHREMMERD